MRSLIAITASVAMLLAQVPSVPAYAQNALPTQQATIPSPVVAATFKAFPSGGEALSMRIADLITANPKLAPEFVVYMRNAEDLNRAQKVAAEQGLAAAADRLGINAQIYCPPGTPPNSPQCTDPWFIALSILGVAAAVGIAVGLSNKGGGGGGGVIPITLSTGN
jgi:hypothetical protein